MPEKLNFWPGLGMALPLMLLGGSFSSETPPANSFYGGIVAGVIADALAIVGCIWLFHR
jgi:hypothetical protein